MVNARGEESPGSTIRITLPAEPRFLAALRVTVRAASALADLAPDDIEDMQIAADEAATLLLEIVSQASDPQLSAELTVAASSFRAVLSVPCTPGRTVARDGLAWLMLVGLDSDVEVRNDRLATSITFGRHVSEN
ncbi:MAG: hypothetical protein ACTHJM_05265 [Marmoricola sp.]